MFEKAKQALDPVSGFIDFPVIADRRFPVRTRRNNRFYAPSFQIIPDVVAVITLIGNQGFGRSLRQFNQHFVRFAVRRFPAREPELERPSGCIAEAVNFTGEASPQTTKRLPLSPPFAPAACAWPRMIVLSIL